MNLSLFSFAVAILMACIACGDDSGDSGVNPYATAANKSQSTGKSTKSPKPSDSEFADEHDDDADDESISDADNDAAESTCLTGSCSTPVNLQFSFTAPVSISPGDCATVSKMKVLPVGDQLWVFTMSNCGGSPYLYLQQYSMSGTPASTATLISQNCSTSSNYVMDFAVAGSDFSSGSASSGNGLLVVYSCKTGTSTYRIDARTIAANGNLGVTKIVESSTTTYDVALEWNQAANTYGLVRNGKFMRLQTDGSLLGGAIVIAAKAVSWVRIVNDHWIILQETTSGTKTTSCSKVSSAGVLLCNGNSLGNGSFDFASSSRLLKTDTSSYYTGEAQKTTHFDFNFADCSVYNESNSVVPTNAPGSSSNVRVFTALQIMNDVTLSLFQGYFGLVMAAYQRGSQLKVLSESSIDISDYGELRQGDMALIGQKLYVSYIKNNRAYFVVSNQKVE